MERAWSGGSEKLTAKQHEVMRLLAKGHTNMEIAERLGISLDGAKWHVGELLNKFSVDSRDELVECWEAQRRPIERLRRMAGGLGLISWPKVAIGVGVVAAALGAGAVYFSLGQGAATTASNQVPTPASLPAIPSADLPVQPPEATLDVDEAYDYASQVANERIASHLPEFLAHAGTTVTDLRLIEARFMSPNEAFVARNGLSRWDAPPFATESVWVFSWLGDGLGEIEGPFGGAGDVWVDVLVADRAAPEAIAWRAHVESPQHIQMFFGSSSGLGSRTTAYEAVSDLYHVAWSGSSRLLMFLGANGELCHRATRASGSGGGGCTDIAKITGPMLVLGGGYTVMDGVKSPTEQVVLTSPDVRQVGVIAATGEEERFVTEVIPAALGVPARAAYFSSPLLDGPHRIVAYDASGREVWSVTPPPYAPPPGATPD